MLGLLCQASALTLIFVLPKAEALHFPRVFVGVITAEAANIVVQPTRCMQRKCHSAKRPLSTQVIEGNRETHAAFPP
jgi:hypothetical protein